MVREPESYAVTSSLWEPDTPGYRFGHVAMGTDWTVTILDRPAGAAHDAAMEAYDELDAVERQLSRFEPGSDVWQINRLAAGHPLTVSLCTIDCLLLAGQVHRETQGAFDVTVGALRRCWRDDEEGARLDPAAAELDLARRCTGMDLLELSGADNTVAVRTEGVRVDLGGIGKGYGADEMAKVLRDWDVETALIKAGGSTYLAMDSPPGRQGWRVAVNEIEGVQETREAFFLKDRAISCSEVLPDHQHIIDPRTGDLFVGPRASRSSAPAGALADALSTAFLVMDVQQIDRYCRLHADVGAMRAILETAPPRLACFGKWE